MVVAIGYKLRIGHVTQRKEDVMEKAKDLYRGHNLDCSVQRSVLSGCDCGLHVHVIKQIREFGIVAPIGLDKPYRHNCGALILAVPCVACQIAGLKCN